MPPTRVYHAHANRAGLPETPRLSADHVSSADAAFPRRRGFVYRVRAQERLFSPSRHTPPAAFAYPCRETTPPPRRLPLLPSAEPTRDAAAVAGFISRRFRQEVCMSPLLPPPAISRERLPRADTPSRRRPSSTHTSTPRAREPSRQNSIHASTPGPPPPPRTEAFLPRLYRRTSAFLLRDDAASRMPPRRFIYAARFYAILLSF